MKIPKVKKIVEAVRLSETAMTARQISASVKVPASTVRDWIKKAGQLELNYSTLKNLTDEEVEELLFPRSRLQKTAFIPNWDEFVIASSLPNVTMSTLFRKYQQSVPKGQTKMSRSTFYRELSKLKEAVTGEAKHLCVSNSYIPGEKSMIDYSGQTVTYVDDSNTIHRAQIFVAVLPYSNFTFVTATVDQTRKSWLQAISDMFAFYGGVTKELWLDNATPLVTKADKYDPVCSGEFKNFCKQYGVLPYPVAPRSPTHKASVERAVGLIQKRILDQFSNRRFGSLLEINEAIPPLLAEFNDLPLTSRINYEGETRRTRFEDTEKALLQPLPQFEYRPDCIITVRTVSKENQVRAGNQRVNVRWGYIGQKARIFVNQDTGKIDVYHDTSGDLIGEDYLDGSAPSDVATKGIPEGLKKFTENKEQMLQRVKQTLGDSAYLVALGLAKQHNSFATRHITALLDISRKMDLPTFTELCEIVISRPPITYTHMHEVYLQFVNAKRTYQKRGIACNVPDTCNNARNSEYYRQLGAKRLKEVLKQRAQSSEDNSDSSTTKGENES